MSFAVLYINSDSGKPVAITVNRTSSFNVGSEDCPNIMLASGCASLAIKSAAARTSFAKSSNSPSFGPTML